MNLLRFLFPLSILLLLDIYSFQAIKTVLPNKPWITWTYWIAHIVIYALMFIIPYFAFGKRTLSYPVAFIFFSIIMALYIPKLILTGFMLVEDITRIIRTLFRIGDTGEMRTSEGNILISRAKFLSQIALAVAAVPFAGILYGTIKGKYDYVVKRIKLPIENLPEVFNGLTITQISDIHTGSFDSKSRVQKGIDLVNQQESDFIFFTGDLVNAKTDEIHGFEKIYSQLKAKEGVFSVLGNHDYGDYFRNWETTDDKAKNFQDLLDAQKSFGWNLLTNQNHIFEKEGHKLAIIGVENWSAHRAFRKKQKKNKDDDGNYGNMKEAIKGAEEADIKLLLSHDPTHWDGEIRTKYPDIAATFSGHTHGTQLGIDIPGFIKWSPAKYVYPKWAGLYTEGKQHLYVNRGFGFIGISTRLGMWPEITVFELTKA